MTGDVKPAATRRRKPRPERLPQTNDAVEIAMHAVASGKPLPDVARRLLEEQAHYVRAQTSELRTRQVGERVRAALWAVLAITAAAMVGLIAVVLFQASRTDALVVQSFRVPEAMAGRGLTGEVVATQLLDRLAEMQEQSESTRAASSYANNWENDLKIEIPNTGATAEQIWKLLRGWLGKETRISGEVIETSQGLALTARVGSKPGRRFVSGSNDLDALVTQGADLIYATTQPYRHSVYLQGEPERRENLLRALTSHELPMERKWAYNGLSVHLRLEGDFVGAIAMATKALAIDPEMIPALGNIGAAHQYLGHDQQMVDFFMRERSRRAGDEYDPRIIAGNRCQQNIELGVVLRDPMMIERGAECLETQTFSMSVQAPSSRVEAAIMRHDPRLALLFTQTGEGGLSPDRARLITLYHRLDGEIVRGNGSALTPLMADALKVRDRLAADPQAGAFLRASAPANDWPRDARVLLALGRAREAAALIARTPRDCYECVRTRGLVAEALGDRRAAQVWFLAATQQGPGLPAAFADWGRLLTNAGQYASAEAKLREAVLLAPNWADPLKTWGDLLAVQGKRDEARAKYDAALKLAPNWVALRRARSRLAVGP